MNVKLIQSVKRFVKNLSQPTKDSVKTSIKVCHSFHTLDFPHHIQRNVEEILPEVKKTILYALVEKTSVEQAAEAVSTKNGDTIRYHVKKLTMKEIDEVFKHHLFTCFATLVKNGKIQQPLHLAVDTTDIDYYGEEKDIFVHQKKKKYYYRYFTITVLTKNYGAFPLIVQPVSVFDSLEDLFDQALHEITAQYQRIEKILADRWFFTVEVVKVLKNYAIPFIIGGKQTEKVKNQLKRFPKDGTITTIPYTMKSGKGKTTDVTLHAYWNKTRKDWFLAITWNITSPQEIFTYRSRWGIETAYRMHKALLLSTSTTNSAVRLLYFYLGAVLLACYVCLRAAVCPPYVPLELFEEYVKKVNQPNKTVTLYTFKTRLRWHIQGGEAM